MVRLILGALAAPVLWGALSVPVNLLLGALYGASVALPPYPTSYLLLSLALSFGYSLFAGWGAARIARTGALKIGVAAGSALLVVGVLVQAGVWDAIPLWWHVVFLVMLMPMCILGARLSGR